MCRDFAVLPLLERPLNFRVRFCLVLSLAASSASAALLAQMPAYDQAGPVPPSITAAKSVFIANAGADSGLFPEPFTGDTGRAYTEFFTALQATKQYALVSDPSQADLVLELRLEAPNGPANPNKQNGAADPEPQFKLIVYDRKTHYVLWTFTQSIDPALLQKTHDKNFDTALADLLNQFLALAGKPPLRAPAPSH
jgi:hypothetical protein